MRRAMLSVLLSLALLLITVPVMAVTLTFTDTSTKAEFNIDYSLAVTSLSFDTYQGVFTIASSSTAVDPWYIGAFDFKFFDGAGNVIPDIADLSSITGSIGPWSIADVDNPNVSIQGWSRQDGRAGFYLTNLASAQTFANAQNGVLVSGTNNASFTFTFLDSGTLNEFTMPFQVGYFDGAKNNAGVFFGQLSADLTVPEPGTLLLLGSGLVGLATFGRKRFKR